MIIPVANTNVPVVIIHSNSIFCLTPLKIISYPQNTTVNTQHTAGSRLQPKQYQGNT